jgi:MYXO-CTERM domain-containing protein
MTSITCRADRHRSDRPAGMPALSLAGLARYSTPILQARPFVV